MEQQQWLGDPATEESGRFSCTVCARARPCPSRRLDRPWAAMQQGVALEPPASLLARPLACSFPAPQCVPPRPKLSLSPLPPPPPPPDGLVHELPPPPPPVPDVVLTPRQPQGPPPLASFADQKLRAKTRMPGSRTSCPTGDGQRRLTGWECDRGADAHIYIERYVGACWAVERWAA